MCFLNVVLAVLQNNLQHSRPRVDVCFCDGKVEWRWHGWPVLCIVTVTHGSKLTYFKPGHFMHRYLGLTAAYEDICFPTIFVHKTVDSMMSCTSDEQRAFRGWLPRSKWKPCYYSGESVYFWVFSALSFLHKED